MGWELGAQYRITSLETIERIAWLDFKEATGELALAEIDEDFRQREAYREGAADLLLVVFELGRELAIREGFCCCFHTDLLTSDTTQASLVADSGHSPGTVPGNVVSVVGWRRE